MKATELVDLVARELTRTRTFDWTPEDYERGILGEHGELCPNDCARCYAEDVREVAAVAVATVLRNV